MVSQPVHTEGLVPLGAPPPREKGSLLVRPSLQSSTEPMSPPRGPSAQRPREQRHGREDAPGGRGAAARSGTRDAARPPCAPRPPQSAASDARPPRCGARRVRAAQRPPGPPATPVLGVRKAAMPPRGLGGMGVSPRGLGGTGVSSVRSVRLLQAEHQPAGAGVRKRRSRESGGGRPPPAPHLLRTHRTHRPHAQRTRRGRGRRHLRVLQGAERTRTAMPDVLPAPPKPPSHWS